ncbi:retinol dehydrogenase 11-like [Choristoneura fumiferana]|uniref:retinol dehydrogenase 11-like n=1 Tax=Choristoneura fumiferana TaxID=7141 RepID=UPI003D15E89C
MASLLVVTVFLATPAILILVRLYQKSTNAICTSKKRLDGRTAIVTGGTAGIGLEIAKEFAHRGARVIIACPFKQEGSDALKTIIEETGNKNISFKLLDLSSLKSVREFAGNILTTEERLDLLINNAGISSLKDFQTKDGMNFIMQVNYYGHFLLTILLLPLLKKTGQPSEPSRIVNTSSYLHWFGRIDNENMNKSGYYWIPNYQYCNSKICMVSFSRELMRRLKGANVVVNSANPGTVGTGIYKPLGLCGLFIKNMCYLLFKTPREGAQTAIYVALDEKTGGMSGCLFGNCKESLVSPLAYWDTAKLWEESVRLVQLTDKELELSLK